MRCSRACACAASSDANLRHPAAGEGRRHTRDTSLPRYHSQRQRYRALAAGGRHAAAVHESSPSAHSTLSDGSAGNGVSSSPADTPGSTPGRWAGATSSSTPASPSSPSRAAGARGAALAMQAVQSSISTMFEREFERSLRGASAQPHVLPRPPSPPQDRSRTASSSASLAGGDTRLDEAESSSPKLNCGTQPATDTVAVMAGSSDGPPDVADTHVAADDGRVDDRTLLRAPSGSDCHEPGGALASPVTQLPPHQTHRVVLGSSSRRRAPPRASLRRHHESGAYRQRW